ncbi:hypothetical protein [Rhodopila sp.]|jgi:hypothetical protein|uniref:hypothetical protein n=1 Tax=Rhodopila sp. TaxID=2480087 RepID=UPI002C9CE01C|nr:hypothetical protein [Rhodopila sp.]HVZ06804.1 hypothetical protein [Rhodopila sp.]
MAERLLSTEFAKSGAPSSPARELLDLISSVTANTARADATPAAVMAVELRRAYITYSAPVLQLLAGQPDQAIEERDLFKQVSAQVSQPDFGAYRLALGALRQEGLIVADGVNEFGDALYKITGQGRAVAPPQPA